jgi:hypothetical protein
MATLADFTTKFPTLGAAPAAIITDALAEAAREVSETAWGSRSDDGILWLAAHLVHSLDPAFSPSASVSGPVTKMRVGDRDVAFANPLSSDGGGSDWLKTTKYGLRYLHLRDLVFGSRKL